MARIYSTSRDGFSDETQMYKVENGMIHVNCPGVSGIIIEDIEGLA